LDTQAYITVEHTTATARGTHFVAAFQVCFAVYGASVSGTKVLEASVCRQLLI